MEQKQASVSLGFTNKAFPAGIHVCQIFSDDEEWEDSLVKYLVSGLKSEEKTCCFSEKMTEERLSEHLKKHGLSYSQAEKKGSISLSKTNDIYFKDERFDPERMLQLLTHFHQASVKEGYPASRVIGEMTPRVQHIDGGSRLFEYESRVSLLLKEHPVTAVCQYDARTFDGATILDILKVHPYMIVRGEVVQNPFFIPPEIFLAQKNSSMSR